MDLPSFLWLWRIAAWSMGLTLLAYAIQALTGWQIAQTRRSLSPSVSVLAGLTLVHRLSGVAMLLLVLLLLLIGLVGTLGHYGDLGHSIHLPLGLLVVGLVCLSAATAWQIINGNDLARAVHVFVNGALFFALALVSWSGWVVVQKYL
ncbi:MAG: DUF4079 family protein [Prochlorotrichaceae cyanobacterium]